VLGPENALTQTYLYCVFRGRLASWGSLVLLIALAGAAVGLSVSTARPSPPLPPFANDAAAAATLERAAENTLHAPSYVATYKTSIPGQGPYEYSYVYQSPNRSETTVGVSTIITIGEVGYTTTATAPIPGLSAPGWLRFRVRGESVYRTQIRGGLELLTSSDAVQRNGTTFNTFTATWVPAIPDAHISAGWLAQRTTATVSDRRVSREQIMPTLVGQRFINPSAITFSDFGAATVNPPPADQVQQAG